MFQFQKSRDCWFDSPRRIELHDRALHQHEEQLLVDNQQDDFEDDGRVEREEQLECARMIKVQVQAQLLSLNHQCE